MYTNIQEYFRFYLALFLTIVLAVGVRLQAAPLGAGRAVADTPAPAGRPLPSAAGAVALR